MYIVIKDWKRVGTELLKSWTYKLIKETRSNAQNRLYHWYLADIKQAFDDKWIFITQIDLHEWLKQKLLWNKYKINPLTKKRTVLQKSTAKLSTKEFSEYIKDIEKYLVQEFEIYVRLRTDLI